MKQTIIAVVLISALLLVAGCGDKSASGAATKEGYDLYDVHDWFMFNCRTKGQLVVGANAPALDVVSQTFIATELQKTYSEICGKPLSIENVHLDNEVAEITMPTITVGCDNDVTARVLATTQEGCKEALGVTGKQAKIKVVDVDGHPVVIVAGTTPEATKRAATRLSNAENAPLTGTEVIA